MTKIEESKDDYNMPKKVSCVYLSKNRLDNKNKLQL